VTRLAFKALRGSNRFLRVCCAATAAATAAVVVAA